ncbi:MAG: HAMP domain-containing histidine kinase [Phycisphaeraceae bacterium]|nr:HAMP domain-containing histidine kinase [Phycisphaeraceae bacterium]MCW5753313.1 HAMP domain-containing histidine kinase [Phycisphaeraceae bacterium]
MSLRVKFALLLSLLALAVLGGAAAAAWSFQVLHRETAAPFRNFTGTLAALATIDRNAEEQIRMLVGSPALRAQNAAEQPHGSPEEWSDSVFNRFLDLSYQSRDVFETESATQGWRIRASQAGSARLAELLDHARDQILLADQRGESPDRGATARILEETRQLISRMQARILTDADLALDFSGRLRIRLFVVLSLTIAIAVLCGLLGHFLVRRWVLQPVAELRSATARYGEGDFAHRVSAQGNDEIACLGREVNRMAGTITTMQNERLQRERLAAVGEMVRRLAHNIRNPLAGIRGLAELTRAELDPSSELRENQQRIVLAVDRFENWLADLLRATNPLEVRPERTEIRPWLRGLIEPLRALAQSNEVAIAIRDDSAPQSAVFDPRHLEYAIGAIVENAIAATPPGGSVEVTCRLHDASEGLSIEIRDGGQGIPSELRERVFLPGFTTKPGGTGTGLAVAHQIVRAHGGGIEILDGVHPELGGTRSLSGACFQVLLPGAA